jgi:two-component system sensor histidine kinase KdpD
VDSSCVSLAGAANHAAARIDDDEWQEHWAAMITIPLTQRRATAAGRVRTYAEAAVMVVGATLLGLAIAPRWGNSPVDLLYLPAVLGAAILGGLAPALFAALASVLAYNFFFTAPRGTFRIDSPVDIVTVVVLLLVALVTAPASRTSAKSRPPSSPACSAATRFWSAAGPSRGRLRPLQPARA